MSVEVPEGWKTATLDDVCSLIARGDSPKYADGKTGLWALGQRCIRDEGIDWDHLRPHSSDKRIKEQSILQPGDVCINSTGTGTLGRVGFLAARQNEVVFADTHVTVLRADMNEAWPRFIFEWLRSEPTRKRVYKECVTGSTNQIELSRSALKSLSLLVPPLHEQRRIAEILSGVDDAIAATRAVIEQNRKVMQGVLERLLTKGISHTRFKQTEIGEIPEGWGVASLVDAGVNIVDGDRGKEYPKAEDYHDEGYCLFLSAKNVTRAGFVFAECQFISEEKHKKLRNGLLQRSDIVVTTRGTIGNFAFYGPDIEFDHMRINSGMAVMRSIGSRISPDFLFALTASELIDDQLKRRVFGSAQPQLTLDILRKLLVPVPPQEEQVSISAKSKEFREVEKKQREELTAMQQFKAALTTDLLTGRKRVADVLPMAAE